MKNSCDVIQDLLPLYCDGACSGESRHLVEEHLRECGECRETYELMRSALPARAVPSEDGQGRPQGVFYRAGRHRGGDRRRVSASWSAQHGGGQHFGHDRPGGETPEHGEQ